MAREKEPPARATALQRLVPCCVSSRKSGKLSDKDAADGSADDPFRLPRYARPTHYDIKLLSDTKRLRFQGVVTITLDIVDDTNKITVNVAPELKTSRFIVRGKGIDKHIDVVLEPDSERAVLPLGHTIKAGTEVRVTSAFAADIDASLTGYYYSTWQDGDEKGNYALTQFAPTAARRAFPCLDEPELKAQFTFSMIHRASTKALGNMPRTSTSAVDAGQFDDLLRTDELDFPLRVRVNKPWKWRYTQFATSPRMSTYLLAFANGNFVNAASSFKSPLTGERLPLRVYTTPEFKHQAKWALEVKKRVLPEYERVFDIAYPLPKLDTLAVADFGAGAMENWGLIMGRTTAMLNDSTSGLHGRKSCAGIESHEIAHMWFGNIVTFRWWDNVWLNEAFATLMGEVIILSRVFPQWHCESSFVADHLARALDLDAMRSSHPIEIPLYGKNVEAAINQVCV